MKTSIVVVLVSCTLSLGGTALLLRYPTILGAPPTSTSADDILPNKSVDEWIGVLKSSDPAARKQAAVALSSFGSAAKPAVSILGKLLREDSDAEVRQAIVIAISALGPTGKSLIPDLTAALKNDKNARVRQGAAEALGNFGSSAAPATMVLAEALSDKDVSVCQAAAQAIGNLGPSAKKAISKMVEALHSDDAEVRLAVVSALGSLGLSAKAAVPALIGALNDSDDEVRLAAIDALAGMGADAKTAVPFLVKLLNDSDEEQSRATIEALGKIGPDAKAAVPALVKCLANPVEETRIGAAEALAEIGPDAKDAVVALTKALKDTDDGVREAAIFALGEIGPDAKSAIPALKQLLNQDTGISEVATEALEKIDSTFTTEASKTAPTETAMNSATKQQPKPQSPVSSSNQGGKEVTLQALNTNPERFDGQTVSVRGELSGTLYEGTGRYHLTVKGARLTADGSQLRLQGMNFVIPKGQKERLTGGFEREHLYPVRLIATVKQENKAWFAVVSEIERDGR